MPARIALFTYLVGFWCYLFLAAIAAWPRPSVMAWLNYVFIQAVYGIFWPILVALESIRATLG